MLLALFGLLAQTEKPTGFYLKEVVKIDYPGSEAIVLENHTWVGKNRVRTDRLDLNTTIIYDLDIHIVYVIDHNTKTYQISRAPVPKDESRLSLIGLAPIKEGTLERRSPIAEKTGNRKKIGSFVCEEYRLLYPPEYGMETTIWTAYHHLMTKSYVRKIWYSAIGTAPPGDVKYLINEILRAIRGVPVQTITSVELEGHKIKTTSTLTQIEPYYEDEMQLMSIPSGYQMKRTL